MKNWHCSQAQLYTKDFIFAGCQLAMKFPASMPCLSSTCHCTKQWLSNPGQVFLFKSFIVWSSVMDSVCVLIVCATLTTGSPKRTGSGKVFAWFFDALVSTWLFFCVLTVAKEKCWPVCLDLFCAVKSPFFTRLLLFICITQTLGNHVGKIRAMN